MAVTKRILPSGTVRWRARVLIGRVEVAARSFGTKREAQAWHGDQAAKFRSGEWVDPRRGDATFSRVAVEWQAARAGKAARTQDTETYLLTRLLLPTLGRFPVASISEADLTTLLGKLATAGVATSTRARALAVVRGVMAHAVSDRRLRVNVASAVKAPRGGYRRTGRPLTMEDLERLAAAVRSECRQVVLVLGLCGLRFSEMAALTVGDVLNTPRGLALRVHRAAPQRRGSGPVVLGPTKTHRMRLVPLPAGELYEYVAGRIATADPDAWLFSAPRGGIWTNTNFRARAQWREVTERLGIAGTSIHDLRHTAATNLLYAGADLKAVQGVLGHASATMTADLYGHLVEVAPWQAMAALADLQSRTPDGNEMATLRPAQ